MKGSGCECSYELPRTVVSDVTACHELPRCRGKWNVQEHERGIYNEVRVVSFLGLFSDIHDYDVHR